RPAFGLLRGLDCDGGVSRERHEDVELLLRWTPSAPRLTDGEDREHATLRILERHEQLVLGVPRFRVVRRFELRDITGARVLAPVEGAVRDQIRAAPVVTLDEEWPPATPLVCTPEERLLGGRTAVDVRDTEVVELPTVEIEDHGLELQRLGDAPHDRG